MTDKKKEPTQGYAGQSDSLPVPRKEYRIEKVIFSGLTKGILTLPRIPFGSDFPILENGDAPLTIGDLELIVKGEILQLLMSWADTAGQRHTVGTDLLLLNATAYATKGVWKIVPQDDRKADPQGSLFEMKPSLYRHPNAFKLICFLLDAYWEAIKHGHDPRDPLPFKKTLLARKIGYTKGEKWGYREVYEALDYLTSFCVYLGSGSKTAKIRAIQSFVFDHDDHTAPVLIYFDKVGGEILHNIINALKAKSGLADVPYGGKYIKLPEVVCAAPRGAIGDVGVMIMAYLYSLNPDVDTATISHTLKGHQWLTVAAIDTRPDRQCWNMCKGFAEVLGIGGIMTVSPDIKVLKKLSSKAFRNEPITVTFTRDSLIADGRMRAALIAAGHPTAAASE